MSRIDEISKKVIGLFLGPILFLLVLVVIPITGLSWEGKAVLASTLWIAVWWILEVMPIAVTALLPIILFPLTGALSLSDTTASFGHHYIFLYIGGFTLAIAIERWNLHKRIALNIIYTIGTNIKSIILGFMVSTAFLSMWISNTAASVIMLPIGVAIINQLKNTSGTTKHEREVFAKALMLGIAYSASIGGVATLIGTPPNLVFAGIVQELYGVEITFSKWIVVGLPASIIMFVICWKYLTEFAFSFEQQSLPGGREEVQKQLKALGKISYEEKVVLWVFIGTAFAWVCRSYLLSKIIPGIHDTIIAIMAGVLLFLLPAGREKHRNIINWKEAVKLPWGILLLFGGGLALANGFIASGLAEWIGEQMSLLQGMPLILLLLILVTSVKFLTEITSNLATTAMLLPILALLAAAIGVHPFIIMVGVTLGASCAFMLPVATPPNAIVFGSGYLKISDMVRCGIWLNLISIVILVLFTYFFLPYLWDLDSNISPINVK